MLQNDRRTRSEVRSQYILDFQLLRVVIMTNSCRFQVVRTSLEVEDYTRRGFGGPLNHIMPRLTNN